MRRKLRGVAKFAIALLVMTIICTMVWQFLGASLYDCTDDGVLGFWTPGDWVHSWQGHPVMSVHQVVHARSMSEPDTIKEGWSVTGLWCLWYSFVVLSVVFSVLLARTTWVPVTQRSRP